MIKYKLMRFGFDNPRFVIYASLNVKNIDDRGKVVVTGALDAKNSFEFAAERITFEDSAGHDVEYPNLYSYNFRDLMQHEDIIKGFNVELVQGEDILKQTKYKPPLPEGAVD